MSNICLCCESGLKTLAERTGPCPFCGAYQDACRSLIKHNLDPYDWHQYLGEGRRWYELDTRKAEAIIRIYKIEGNKETKT
jgi:hypothetical protein